MRLCMCVCRTHQQRCTPSRTCWTASSRANSRWVGSEPSQEPDGLSLTACHRLPSFLSHTLLKINSDPPGDLLPEETHESPAVLEIMSCSEQVPTTGGHTSGDMAWTPLPSWSLNTLWPFHQLAVPLPRGRLARSLSPHGAVTPGSVSYFSVSLGTGSLLDTA